MSTILKALRRLEKEKARSNRPLREQIASAGGSDDPRPRRWPILLAGIGAGVVAGLAVLFLLVLRDRTAEETPGAAPAEAAAVVEKAAPAQAPPEREVARAPRPGKGRIRPIPPREARVAARVPAPAPEAPPATAPGAEPADEVAVIERGAPPPRMVDEPKAAPSADAPKPGSVRPFGRSDPTALPGGHLLPEGEIAPEVEPGAGASPPTPSPAPSTARRPQPPGPAASSTLREGAAIATAKPPEPRAEERPAVEAPAPMPSTAKVAAPAFPPLRVERTTWHPTAERRVALVEVPSGQTQTVHEGEVVEGALVRRIEPSGVVFEHAGREVRRKVGEGG